MAHQTKIVLVRELSDQQVAYCVECCGEAATRSWHTVSVAAADLEASLAEHKNRVAALHEAKVQWRLRMANSGEAGAIDLLT